MSSRARSSSSHMTGRSRSAASAVDRSRDRVEPALGTLASCARCTPSARPRSCSPSGSGVFCGLLVAPAPRPLTAPHPPRPDRHLSPRGARLPRAVDLPPRRRRCPLPAPRVAPQRLHVPGGRAAHPGVDQRAGARLLQGLPRVLPPGRRLHRHPDAHAPVGLHRRRRDHRLARPLARHHVAVRPRGATHPPLPGDGRPLAGLLPFSFRSGEISGQTVPMPTLPPPRPGEMQVPNPRTSPSARGARRSSPPASRRT